jgi:hypothetical protein
MYPLIMFFGLQDHAAAAGVEGVQEDVRVRHDRLVLVII